MDFKKIQHQLTFIEKCFNDKAIQRRVDKLSKYVETCETWVFGGAEVEEISELLKDLLETLGKDVYNAMIYQCSLRDLALMCRCRGSIERAEHTSGRTVMMPS